MFWWYSNNTIEMFLKMNMGVLFLYVVIWKGSLLTSIDYMSGLVLDFGNYIICFPMFTEGSQMTRGSAVDTASLQFYNTNTGNQKPGSPSRGPVQYYK